MFTAHHRSPLSTAAKRLSHESTDASTVASSLPSEPAITQDSTSDDHCPVEGLTACMVANLLASTSKMAAQLIKEAATAIRKPTASLIEDNRWMKMYESHEPPTSRQPSTTSSTSSARLFGVTQLHVSLDQVVDVLLDSATAFSLRHPGAIQGQFNHALEHDESRRTSLRSFTVDSSSVLQLRREFQVVECHRVFTRGVAVLFHSVDWDGGPGVDPTTTVRGGLYRSGLVVLESELNDDSVDVYCVAQVHLKGMASVEQSRDASRERVLATLSRLARAVEQRAKRRLALGDTIVFRSIARTQSMDSNCSECSDRIALLPPRTEPYRCRKCLVPVCSECSHLWRLGRSEMRLCRDCWSDAQPALDMKYNQ